MIIFRILLEAEGIGLDTLAAEARHRHQFAYAPRPDERALPLDPGGVYHSHQAERNIFFNPTIIHKVAESNPAW